MKVPIAIAFVFSCFVLFSCSKSSSPPNSGTSKIDSTPLPGTISQTDTLRVMAYNVLSYGDACQGPTSTLDAYLNTIVQYTAPDLMSCEKINAFPFTPGAVGNLGDELLANALNLESPNKYNYAAPTNATNLDKMSVLFYNQQKLAYVATENLLSLGSDFDFYKLYYKDVNLPITKDTTFLFVLVCHTKSGSSSTERDYQDSAVISTLRTKFSYFPNLIIMGDFNTTGSYEKGYQSIINSKDSTTKMSDPPYYPDQLIKYPGDWNTIPDYVAHYLTTSTRSLPDVPNSCGTSAGGKGWYDHIFISPWLVNGTNYIQYVSKSYQSVGNDGARLGVSINSDVPVINTSAPSTVLDALFQFSDKYPVMINLTVKANRNAVSPKDPMEK